MNATNWLTLGIGIFSLILVPLLVFIIRIAMKYQKIDDRMLSLEERSLENQKQMQDRVRWLEENLWGQKRGQR